MEEAEKNAAKQLEIEASMKEKEESRIKEYEKAKTNEERENIEKRYISSINILRRPNWSAILPIKALPASPIKLPAPIRPTQKSGILI